MSALSDYFYKGPAFTLEDGREINIKSINQCLAYDHVLEGIPYGPNYSFTVNLHFRWARERYPSRKIKLLKPRLRPLAIPEDELNELRSRWVKSNEIRTKFSEGHQLSSYEIMESEWPEPVCIGSVCCRALFESKPIDDEAGMLSELIVIWFQDGFAMPIDPDVIEQIKAIDWNKEAEDTDL